MRGADGRAGGASVGYNLSARFSSVREALKRELGRDRGAMMFKMEMDRLEQVRMGLARALGMGKPMSGRVATMTELDGTPIYFMPYDRR